MSQDKQHAWELFRQEKIEEALPIVQKLLQEDSDNAELNYLIACCYSQTGRFATAIRHFNESLKKEPDVPYTYVALGAAYNSLGSTREAAQSYQRALQLNPTLTDAILALADMMHEAGNIEITIELHQRAAKLTTDSGWSNHRLGLLYREQGRDKSEILETFQEAVRREPDNPNYLASLAECLISQERFDEALPLLKHALEQDADNILALGNIATIEAKFGNYSDAEKYVDAVLEKNTINADAAIAFLMISKHLDRCDEAVSYAESCLKDSNIPKPTIKNIKTQLSHVYDHLGKYDKAWEYISSSKTIDSDSMRYDPVIHKVVIDKLIKAFNPTTFINLRNPEIDDDTTPIFIIGMPRSGTSLLEQILSAHPQISGAGELTEISDIIKDIPQQIDTDKDWPECIDDATTDDISKFAKRYLAHLKQHAPESHYITDKMPHNFYALGLIRIMFPKAKIIHCQRHAMDTCISIYFQNFLVGHDYAANLFNLGTHHYQYQRLMQHWRECLPGGMIEINYEDLVQSPDETIRNIMDYCELPWDDACLNFHRSSRQVSTASFDQVRQPLHSRSVQRWMHYDQYLDELKDGLDRGH